MGKNRIINLSAIVLSLFLLRLMLPQFVKYVLFPAVLILGFVALFHFKSVKFLLKNKYLFVFFPVGLVFLIYFIAFILTANKPMMLCKEVLNNAFIAVFVISLLILITSLNNFDAILDRFRRCSIWICCSFALFGFVKFVLQLYNVRLGFISVPILGYPDGTSLAIDNNFYSLSCIMVSFFLIYESLKSTYSKWNLGIQFLSFLLLLSTIFSTSRRGLIFCVLILFSILLLWIIFFVRKRSSAMSFCRKTIILFFLFVVSSGFIYFFFSNINPDRRNELLKRSLVNRTEVNSFVENSFGFLLPHTSSVNYDSLLWSNNIDSRFLQSGWARGNYKIVNSIEGANSGIVPLGALGAMVSRGVDSYYYNNASKYYSSLCRTKTDNNKRYVSSVYCFVSNDCDADDVYLAYENNGRHIRYIKYDKRYKNTWQKLQFSLANVSAEISSTFYVRKNGDPDLSKLHGYVIYAYPEFKEVEFNPMLPITWNCSSYVEINSLFGNNKEIVAEGTVGAMIDNSIDVSTWGGNAYYYVNLFSNGDKIIGNNNVSIYCYVSPEYDGSDVYLVAEKDRHWIRQIKYDLSKKGEWQKLEIDFVADTSDYEVIFYISKNGVTDFSSLKGEVVIAYPEINVGLIEQQVDTLKLQQNVCEASFFSISNLNNDSTITPKFQKKYDGDGFIGLRLDHWRYAFYLYRNDYNAWQQLFGNNFDYTRKFAKMFYYCIGITYSYPHNPFLSVLLYSGLLGLIVYFWFIYKAIYYYWIYRKKYWVYGLCFIACSFFTFFSSNTPFEPAICGIFAIMPYFIHFYHLVEKNNSSR